MKIGILAQNKEINYTGINKVTIGTVSKLRSISDHDIAFVGKTDWLKLDVPYVPFVPATDRLLLLDYLLEEHKFDIIHSHFRPFDFSSRHRCAKILTIHDLLPILFPGYCPPDYRRYFDECVRKSAERADAIITVSGSTKRDVIKYFGVKEEKIHVVYNGLYPDTNIDDVNTSELVSLKGKRYLLSVSAVGKIKNQVGIVRAFADYKTKNPDSDLKLVFTGPVRQYENIRIILENYKELVDDIIVTGYVSEEELAWVYQNSEAVIYASFYEGFGLPILEAMHYGKAVISSNTSSMPEVGGDSVEYCDPNDIGSIEEAIKAVLDDEEHRRILEKKAKERASLFSYDRAARETMEIYKSFM